MPTEELTESYQKMIPFSETKEYKSNWEDYIEKGKFYGYTDTSGFSMWTMLQWIDATPKGRLSAPSAPRFNDLINTEFYGEFPEGNREFKNAIIPAGEWSKGAIVKCYWYVEDKYLVEVKFELIQFRQSIMNELDDRPVIKALVALAYDIGGSWITDTLSKLGVWYPISVTVQEGATPKTSPGKKPDFSDLPYSSKKATPNFLPLLLLGAGAVFKAPLFLAGGAGLWLINNAPKKTEKKFDLKSLPSRGK